jgi:hypothetical protein
MPKISDKKQKELKKLFLEMFVERHGIVRTCLRELKISTTLYYGWIDKDADFKEKVDEAQKLAIEFVESMLFKNIEKGDRTSIIFYLKSKGGYVDRQVIDQNITMNEPVKLNIILPEQPEKLEGGPDKMIEI